MQASANWVSDSRFEIRTQNGTFHIGPKPDGPSDPSPVEYLAASLAGCVGHYIAKFLGRRDLDLKRLAVKVSGTMVEDPHRIGAFDIVVDIPPGLSPGLRGAVQRAAESCTIHHTLQNPPKITFTYNTH